MPVIEPVEILLDKPRKFLINHTALRRAETEVNKQRFAKPIEHTNIDNLMVSAYNTVYRLSGMLPRDLLTCLLWASHVPENPKEAKLTIEKIDDLLDQSQSSDADIAVILWNAYFKVAGRNFGIASAESEDSGEEKKTEAQPTGSGSGPRESLN